MSLESLCYEAFLKCIIHIYVRWEQGFVRRFSLEDFENEYEYKENLEKSLNAKIDEAKRIWNDLIPARTPMDTILREECLACFNLCDWVFEQVSRPDALDYFMHSCLLDSNMKRLTVDWKPTRNWKYGDLMLFHAIERCFSNQNIVGNITQITLVKMSDSMTSICWHIGQNCHSLKKLTLTQGYCDWWEDEELLPLFLDTKDVWSEFRDAWSKVNFESSFFDEEDFRQQMDYVIYVENTDPKYSLAMANYFEEHFAYTRLTKTLESVNIEFKGDNMQSVLMLLKSCSNLRQIEGLTMLNKFREAVRHGQLFYNMSLQESKAVVYALVECIEDSNPFKQCILETIDIFFE